MKDLEKKNPANIREVRLLKDVYADEKLIKSGTILLAAFHPDPEKAKGLCFPLSYDQINLRPHEYEVVILQREWDELLTKCEQESEGGDNGGART